MMFKQYLHDILCCPACRGSLSISDVDGLVCNECNRNYRILDGIPDLRFFDDTQSFDAKQALYEEELHDKEAITDYEERVVQMWGQKTKLMVNEWAKETSGRILDFGCGTGQVSNILTKHHNPIFAFDISLESVKKNVDKNKVVGILANAFHLPFRDCCFDAVCINGVLHHIVNYRTVVGEISRVTKDKVFISEMCPARYKLSIARCGLTFPVVLNFTLKLFLKFRQIFSKNRLYFGGSKFEKPVDLGDFICCLRQNNFDSIFCNFWTNLDYRPRNEIIKIALTRLLVSKKGGTHFDVRARKFRAGGLKARLEVKNLRT